MIKISNNNLAGFLVNCFNPSLVSFQGEILLFYRFIISTSRLPDYQTDIAFVKLDPTNFQPISKHQPVNLTAMTALPATFDDPRVFVWMNKLWIMYIQSVKTIAGKWSSAIVISEIDLDGQVIQTHVPKYGNNINFAVSEDAPPAQEKNWSPVVIGDNLYFIYELNPLTVIKFQIENNTCVQISSNPWESHFQTYLSGSTALIPWRESEYIGIFHTYKSSKSIRTYSMGFYTIDINQWRVTHISSELVLVAKTTLLKKLFGRFLKKLWYSKYSKIYWLGKLLHIIYGDPWNVIYTCGLIDYGEDWAVSIGYNHQNCYIETYDKVKISESFDVV
jgi:hypothetical protein